MDSVPVPNKLKKIWTFHVTTSLMQQCTLPDCNCSRTPFSTEDINGFDIVPPELNGNDKLLIRQELESANGNSL